MQVVTSRHEAHAHHGDSSAPVSVGDSSAPVSVEAFWDERYRSSSALWSGHPNPQLVTETAGLHPGTALDVGCGEGADAIWLAEHGWQVTAVDISTFALQRATAQALRMGSDIEQRITWVHADVIDYHPSSEAFDLVSAQFMHLPTVQREALHRRLAASVRPGGTLLIVGHDPSDLQTNVPRPSMPELFVTASEIAASLAPKEWVILVAEARARQTLDPDGHPVTIHDAVVRAQRKG